MKSIRRQLTLTLLLGFGLLLILSSAAIYFFTRMALLKEFDAGLRAKALTVMSLTEQGKDGIQVEVPNAFFDEPENDVAPRFYEMWQTNGVVCARAESLKGTDLPRHFGSTSEPAYWNLNLPDGQAARAIGLKFTPKPEDEDSKSFSKLEAIMVVASDRQALDRTLNTLAAVLLTAGLLTLLITAPVVQISLRRGHAPLGELARMANAITADSLQSRFPVDAMPEELRPIAARLNDLLLRLEESFARERRFSADLAHELRTPLAELRSHAEVELAWPEGEAGEKHGETLNIALQMEAMVTRLLDLARSENGKFPLHVESIPVAALLQEIWNPLAHKAQRKQLVFTFTVPPDLSIQTDGALFRSILTNLLSNAMEYAPEKGQGEIRWEEKTAELTFSNSVLDLNAADLPHLFERLWRKDKSRTGSEHCGLGLALSQTFARLLGFSLKARFSEEKTLTLYLNLRAGETPQLARKI